MAGGHTGSLLFVTDPAEINRLRIVIAAKLRAKAQIKANPTRKCIPPVDWALNEERHQAECFFNELKRFRRIALRCE